MSSIYQKPLQGSDLSGLLNSWPIFSYQPGMKEVLPKYWVGGRGGVYGPLPKTLLFRIYDFLYSIRELSKNYELIP